MIAVRASESESGRRAVEIIMALRLTGLRLPVSDTESVTSHDSIMGSLGDRHSPGVIRPPGPGPAGRVASCLGLAAAGHSHSVEPGINMVAAGPGPGPGR